LGNSTHQAHHTRVEQPTSLFDNSSIYLMMQNNPIHLCPLSYHSPRLVHRSCSVVPLCHCVKYKPIPSRNKIPSLIHHPDKLSDCDFFTSESVLKPWPIHPMYPLIRPCKYVATHISRTSSGN